MKYLLVIPIIYLLFTTTGSQTNNNSLKISERAYAATVTIREYWEMGIKKAEYTDVIESANLSDLALTGTFDRRDEHGTGFIYYCYGRKFGYCKMN